MSDLAFELNNVSKSYADFRLDKINLELEKGSIMGFIGPNGAGKSTTIRILMGLTQQDTGDVTVLGHKLPEQHVAAKWQTAYASDDLGLYGSTNLAWHMRYLKNIYPTWDDDYAKVLLKRFDLNAEQKIKLFSFGQKVKASLLLVLARRPKLLILDEPTTGLDPIARHEIICEFMDVLLDEDRSILFSSHNTQDVAQLSDKIAFIDQGKIIQCQDKERYLDSWKRLRLISNKETQLPKLQGIVEQRQSASVATVTIKDFSEDMLATYQHCGAQVSAIERMTLEEIFIAEVQASRKGIK